MTRKQGNWRKTPWQRAQWEEKQHRADDQIAPAAVSRTTAHLQQWALMTANLAQQGLGRREAEIVERIERRYGHGQLVDSHAGSFTPPAANGKPGKRLRSPSPTLQNSASRTGLGAAEPVLKRRRERSPSPHGVQQSVGTEPQKDARSTAVGVAGDERGYDSDYYQSSEWSFPSSEIEDESIK